MCRTTSGHTLPDVDCTKIGLIERFIHTHESNVYETLGSVLAAATPKRVLPSSFGDRLTIAITLILALLAFQFVVNDKLPVRRVLCASRDKRAHF